VLVAEIVVAGRALGRAAVSEVIGGAALQTTGGAAIPQAAAAPANHAVPVDARLTIVASVAATAAVVDVVLAIDALLIALDLRLLALLLFLRLGANFVIVKSEQRGQRRRARDAKQRSPRRRGENPGDVVEPGLIHIAPRVASFAAHDPPTMFRNQATEASRYSLTFRP
jgi:hypothetical protein